MGKRYGVPNAMNISIIQGATLNKRMEVDNYNSKRDEYVHKKPELSLPNKVLEGMFNIYFYGYFNWDKMSKLEKGLYLGFIGMNVFGIALTADYVTKGAVKDTVKKGVNLGKAKVGEAGDFLQGVYKGITAKKAPVAVTAIVPVIAKSPAFAGGNGSEEEKPELTPAQKQMKEIQQQFGPSYISRTANGTEKVTVYIQPDIKANFTKGMNLMAARTPQFYDEIAAYLDGTTIVSGEGFNGHSDESDLISLNPVVTDGMGSDRIDSQLGALASFYAETKSVKVSKTNENAQLKLDTRFKVELFQHRSIAIYRVEAEIDTKENMNAWLRRGGWFKQVEGRFPTDAEWASVGDTYTIK